MKTKICTKCGIEKPETVEFFYFRKERNKFRNNCRVCMDNSVKTFLKLNPWKQIFKNIKIRCNRPDSISYKNYGGRGIECRITEDEVKELWFRDKAYEMEKPSIDRKDNDGHYEFRNCRFIELSENVGRRNILYKKPILQYDKQGNFIREWTSQSDASRQLNIDQACISRVLLNKVKSAGGYKWRYADE